MSDLDYYGLLQISSNAEPATIRRVYQFLASRYHPDNQTTGNSDKFIQLRQAYNILSDPVRRAEYDSVYVVTSPAVPLSSSIDFMDSIEGEFNRRLAVLALLYIQRRSNPYAPDVSLLVLEKRMGFPRDYLDFATWYLRNKNYITRSDNSDFTLTVEGVDFVESKRVSLPVLNNLLTSGSVSSATNSVTEREAFIPSPKSGDTSLIAAHPTDRRGTRKDRRVGAPDLRAVKVERRSNIKDRRGNN
jgi:curved DNA-binding protein